MSNEINQANLTKAVNAVKNGMDVAKAAQKFGINPQALANALNPKGGGKPEDGFEKSYDYKFPIGKGQYVKASKIKTVTLKSGRKVEVFKDIEGKTRFQYRAADGKVINETYFKEQEGMTGKHYALNGKGQLVSVKDEADKKKYSLHLDVPYDSDWNYADATNKNLSEAWEMFKNGQKLDAVIKVLNGVENPNKYTNDSAGMLEFVGGFWKKGGLTLLKQLKNIKNFGQFKTLVSGLIKEANNAVKKGVNKIPVSILLAGEAAGLATIPVAIVTSPLEPEEPVIIISEEQVMKDEAYRKYKNDPKFKQYVDLLAEDGDSVCKKSQDEEYLIHLSPKVLDEFNCDIEIVRELCSQVTDEDFQYTLQRYDIPKERKAVVLRMVKEKLQEMSEKSAALLNVANKTKI